MRDEKRGIVALTLGTCELGGKQKSEVEGRAHVLAQRASLVLPDLSCDAERDDADKRKRGKD